MGKATAPTNPASHVEILREATRDANAAVKDLRQARRDVEEASRAAQVALGGMMRKSLEEMKEHTIGLIEAEINRQVGAITPSVRNATKAAEERILARFNELGEKILNGDGDFPGVANVVKMMESVNDTLERQTVWMSPGREKLAAVGIDEAVARRMLGSEAV